MCYVSHNVDVPYCSIVPVFVILWSPSERFKLQPKCNKRAIMALNRSPDTSCKHYKKISERLGENVPPRALTFFLILPNPNIFLA